SKTRVNALYPPGLRLRHSSLANEQVLSTLEFISIGEMTFSNSAASDKRNKDVALANVTLDDKYVLQSGRAYLSGIQALGRLPIMQRERDRAAGLNTAGFISGYRGSPLGAYDNTLWASRKLLERHDIHFQPGLNEDLAATSVWGSQQVGLFPGAKVDGVFGIWYGKGPGVDRSLDALRRS